MILGVSSKITRYKGSIKKKKRVKLETNIIAVLKPLHRFSGFVNQSFESYHPLLFIL